MADRSQGAVESGNEPMRPFQNRVTPNGEIIADPARGTLMGNRGGRIHDPQTKELTRRRWASRQWIACVVDFKDRQRTVMGEGYTELFFLDEATALAAGHRPCFECRRADARRFARCWAQAMGLERPPRAPEMDRALHAERLEGRRKKTHIFAAQGLPDGVMIDHQGAAFLLERDIMRRWSPSGYGAPVSRATGDVVALTPPSIIHALAAGYAIS